LVIFSVLLHGIPLISPLFPYTTLFRSSRHVWFGDCYFFILIASHNARPNASLAVNVIPDSVMARTAAFSISPPSNSAAARTNLRSEEHTSELQSRENLVCRLLLEKKNK